MIHAQSSHKRDVKTLKRARSGRRWAILAALLSGTNLGILLWPQLLAFNACPAVTDLIHLLTRSLAP